MSDLIRQIAESLEYEYPIVEDFESAFKKIEPQLRRIQDEEFLKYVVNKLVEADPTDNSEYAPWIYKQLKMGNVRFEGIGLEGQGRKAYPVPNPQQFPEDEQRVREALDFFHTHKNLPQFEVMIDGRMERANPDINAYRTINDLEEVVMQGRDQDIVSNRQVNKQGLFDIVEGSRLFAETENWIVVQAFDPEAAAYYGQGTTWCTRTPSTAQGYLERNGGSLFIGWEKVKDGNNIKYVKTFQATANLNEIRNTHDKTYTFNEELTHIFGDLIYKLIDSANTASEAMGIFNANFGQKFDLPPDWANKLVEMWVNFAYDEGADAPFILNKETVLSEKAAREIEEVVKHFYGQSNKSGTVGAPGSLEIIKSVTLNSIEDPREIEATLLDYIKDLGVDLEEFILKHTADSLKRHGYGYNSQDNSIIRSLSLNKNTPDYIMRLIVQGIIKAMKEDTKNIDVSKASEMAFEIAMKKWREERKQNLTGLWFVTSNAFGEAGYDYHNTNKVIDLFTTSGWKYLSKKARLNIAAWASGAALHKAIRENNKEQAWDAMFEGDNIAKQNVRIVLDFEEYNQMPVETIGEWLELARSKGLKKNIEGLTAMQRSRAIADEIKDKPAGVAKKLWSTFPADVQDLLKGIVRDDAENA